jgi:hypothetical protein
MNRGGTIARISLVGRSQWGGQEMLKEIAKERICFNKDSFSSMDVGGGKVRCGQFRLFVLSLLVALCMCPQVQAATNRSTYIPYDSPYYLDAGVALDEAHQQLFTFWQALDRIDVLSTTDYHLIRSISVPSPSSLDISPDGTTLAVATSSAHILFFDTGTFAKTNDIVFADSAQGVTTFVYTANGNGVVRAAEGLSTGGGITAYWNQATNAFENQSNAEGAVGPYQTTGPMARSGDYSKIMLGDATTGGNVQIIDGSSGQVLQHTTFGGYIMGLAANNNASRYAVCVETAGRVLIILDSSFNQLYQDEAGCPGMTFSADGNTLYRDAAISNVLTTQAINMTSFSITNAPSYPASYMTTWQAADSTGMVYGINPNPLNNMIFVALDTAASTAPTIPAVNDPVQIVRVIDNIGSPQGGDVIRILCTGVDTASTSSPSVTIGGGATTNVSVSQLGSFNLQTPTLPNLRIVEVTTPPGTPGLADVVLTAGGNSSTAAKAFQYAQTRTIFPFSTSPTFLLYDDFRQKLYASHGNQVEVIDPVAQQVLAPLFPASGKLANSQFAGLSLSPDGNRLYIADAGAELIHMLDLTNPGTGASISPTTAIGYYAPIYPGRVFETASGMLVGTDVFDIVEGISGGSYPIFVINRMTGQGAQMVDTQGNDVSGLVWNSTNNGENIFISRPLNGDISSQIGLWNDATSEYLGTTSLVSLTDQTQWIVEASANEDGTEIAAGGSTPGVIDNYLQIVDFNLNSMGLLYYNSDVLMPVGGPSFFLHPSGAVLYKSGANSQGSNGGVEIDDIHQYQPVGTIALPEPAITSYSPYLNHMLATDETGRYFFAVTQSGITMMVLNTLPLSIGNLQPAFVAPGGGQTVTIRGSGFQAGAAASFGGTQAATTFVDADTLTALVPALTAGWQDVTVTNANGNSYTYHGALQVIGAQPTPAITGFSPAELIAESGIPGFDTTQTVTIVGSGFAAYDTVEINEQPVDTALVDTSHIQATVPASLTGSTGLIPFTVVSPYTGSSNTLSVPMVNPVPLIQSVSPASLVVGSTGVGIRVYGTNFVPGSTAIWNGQNLAGGLVQGEGSGGVETIMAAVPDNLLTDPMTATITVINSAPGGGTSNAVTITVAPAPPAQPVVSYPASINFGSEVLNIAATQGVSLINTGGATYAMSSVTMSSGPFSVPPTVCTAVAPQQSCYLQLQFLPTTAGAASATLTITDNIAGSPHLIPVTGTGTLPPVPTVTLTSINDVGQTVTATVNGTATVGGASIPATAWIEYGTSQTLATYSQSTSWAFTGDNTSLSGTLTGLNPSTTYAARLAVQTSGGTGKSGIQIFTTMAAPAALVMVIASGGSSSATVSAGQTATYQFMASDGGNGYTGTATFACAGVPLEATCSASPSPLSIGVTPTPFTINITTSAGSSALLRYPPRRLLWALALLLATLAVSFPTRRYRWSMVVCLAALMIFAFACGGGGPSSGGSTPIQTPATPSGTYLLSVIGTAGGVQASYPITLTVK